MLDIIILLSIAVFFIALFQRLSVPPILAYLLVGVLTGPFGFALIAEQAQMELLAEIGIVFLMFSLGLEFSLSRLIAMKRQVLGLGGSQVIGAGFIFICFSLSLGSDFSTAFIIASACLMSSTAIVIKQLNESKLMYTRMSHLSVSVLLFQDVAVVFFLIMIPLFAQSQGDSELLFEQLLGALVKGIFAVAIILSAGRWVLPFLFKQIALSRSDELFVMSTLLVALIAGIVTHHLGLSMALGAFLAGMMLGESPYRHQLDADIRPFRDMLMGLFFITIGMLLDVVALLDIWPRLVMIVVVMMLVKIFVVFVLAKLFGERHRDALATGIVLAQMGEFGFVILALAGKWQLLSSDYISLFIAVGIISMALTPLLIHHHKRITSFLLGLNYQAGERRLRKPFPGQYTDHVVVCGYGRSGQTIARFLKVEGIAYVVIDRDPDNVQEALDGGEKIEFGDATRKDILMMLGVDKAKSVIVTFRSTDDAVKLINTVGQLSDTKVLVRTTDDKHLKQLQEAGASDVVPESLEGSLMMVSHVLSISGVPIKRILKRLQQEREGKYRHLHGFYFGNVDDADNDVLERLHPIRLNVGCFAVDKTVAEMNLKQVTYTGVRRADVEIDKLNSDFVFKAGDVVLICGASYDVKRAEIALLEGWNHSYKSRY